MKEWLTVNWSGRRFSSERTFRRNAAMLLYSMNRMKQTQPVKTYDITRCAHSLGDPFGTFDIESLSMLLNKNFVSVVLAFTLDVPDADRDPAPTFTGISIAMPSINKGTKIFSLHVKPHVVDQRLFHFKHSISLI
jgi:hypothetical protein